MAMGRISHFPIDLCRRPYNTLALACECVMMMMMIVVVVMVVVVMTEHIISSSYLRVFNFVKTQSNIQ